MYSSFQYNISCLQASLKITGTAENPQPIVILINLLIFYLIPIN